MNEHPEEYLTIKREIEAQVAPPEIGAVKKLEDFRTPKPMPKEEREIERKKFNSNPVVKRNGMILIHKRLLNMWILAGIIFFLVLSAGVLWFAYSFSEKDFSTNVNVEGDTILNNHTIIVDNQNDHTININNTIIFPEEIKVVIVNGS